VTLDGVSSTELMYAAAAAGDRWGDQSTSAVFRLAGGTSATDLDPDNCAPDWVGKGLLRVVNYTNVPGRVAEVAVKCGGTSFLVTLYRSNSDGLIPWSTSLIAWPEIDLLSVIVHELGHTQGIGHPGSGEVASMDSIHPGEYYQRDLFQWDVKCARNATIRQLSDYGRAIFGSSFWPIEQTASTMDPISLAAGVAFNVSWKTVQAFNTISGGRIIFNDSMSSLRRVLSMDSYDTAPAVHRYTNVVAESVAVTFTEGVGRPNAYDYWSERPRVKRERSTNEFQTAEAEELEYCLVDSSGCMANWYPYKVESYNPIAQAWHDGLGVPVFAYRNAGSNSSSKLMITAGVHLPYYRLEYPVAFSKKSLVGPGIACKDEAAGGYDCLVAYVDFDDPTLQVKVFRVEVSAGTPNTYSIEASPQTTPARTGSNITMWHQDGKFWMAVRSATYQEPMVIYSSATGATNTWTSQQTYWSTAVTAPSAASNWQGPNTVIKYLR